jgi:hypothetical protein
MVDKQAYNVKQTCKPGDDKYDMKRFDVGKICHAINFKKRTNGLLQSYQNNLDIVALLSRILERSISKANLLK